MTLDTTALLAEAQEGDELAADRFMKIIRDHHMDRCTWRYRGRNILVAEEEIESEFLLGCFKAMSKADLDKGNPLLYVTWKGKMAVASLFRKKMKRDLAMRCYSCTYRGRVGYERKIIRCPECGARNIDTWMVRQSLEGSGGPDGEEWFTWEERIFADDHDRTIWKADRDAWELATFGQQIEEMRDRLSGRILELFDILILEEINRFTQRNYLATIANRWGVTTACVSQYLKRLREEVEAYIATGA